MTKQYLSLAGLQEYDALRRAEMNENDANTLESAKSHSNTNLDAAKAYADNAAAKVKIDLLNGAGTAYDTLKELGDLIDDNVDAIDALEAIASGKASKSEFDTHVADPTKHITSTERTNWNAAYAYSQVAHAPKTHGHTISDIDNLEKSLSDASSAISANTSSISGHTTRITNLENKVGDGFAEITVAEIQALFA